jgi:hypothetical protein
LSRAKLANFTGMGAVALISEKEINENTVLVASFL